MEFPFASARRGVAALVHPDARIRATDRARHELFIFARLATIVLVAALVPRYLAAVGADPLWRIGAIAWLLLPLAAVVHLARTGDLVEAQLISLFSLALLTCIVVVGARQRVERRLLRLGRGGRFEIERATQRAARQGADRAIAIGARHSEANNRRRGVGQGVAQFGVAPRHRVEGQTEPERRSQKEPHGPVTSFRRRLLPRRNEP